MSNFLELTSINSQASVLERLNPLVQGLSLLVTKLCPENEFEVEKFDLQIQRSSFFRFIFSQKTLLTVEEVAKEVSKLFPAKLEIPQLYKINDTTLRVVCLAGYPKEALITHRDIAKKIFTGSEREISAIVEQIPNYQDINSVMTLIGSFIEQKTIQVLSRNEGNILKEIIPSSKLMNDPFFELFPQSAANIFSQASRNIVRFCYSWYFLEQHLLKRGYRFNEKELFKRLYYILLPEAFFPVMSSKLHYEYAASQNGTLCNPNLLSSHVWQQIEKDYQYAKSLEKARVCPALSIEVFLHCKELLFSVFQEAQRRESRGGNLYKNHGLNTILDFSQYLDLSPELLNRHPVVLKINSL